MKTTDKARNNNDHLSKNSRPRGWMGAANKTDGLLNSPSFVRLPEELTTVIADRDKYKTFFAKI